MKRLLYSQILVVFRSVKIVFFSDDSTRFPLYLFLVVPPQKRMPLQSGLDENDFLIFENHSIQLKSVYNKRFDL